MRRQNVEGPAAARAQSRAACGGDDCARRSESTDTKLVDMMSRIVARNRLRDGSIENAACAGGTNRAKLNAWMGRSRSFSRFSSVSVTSNEANKNAMRCAKWTITARRTVLRLAQMKILGSGPRYQILSHVFARCASQRTHGHAKIARISCAFSVFAILAWPCVRLVQRAKKFDTNHIPRGLAWATA